MPDVAARAAFLETIGRPDDEIDLVRCALLIAREEYPGLDLDRYTARLDEMGLEARPHVAAAGGNPFAAIDQLNAYLFRRRGFRGNTEEYFDPRNSYLNEVLDRRRGIPITLSLVYMEVGSRAGLPVDGVGFPGHFLVRHVSGERRIFIDPFHQGMIVTPEDCRQRLAATYGDDVRLETRFLEPSGRRQIVARILHNLRGIYMKAEDHERALAVIERLLAIEPDDAGLLRDRGIAHMHLSHHGRAVADLEAYLRLVPAAADAPAVRRHVVSIRRLTASLN